MRACHTLQDSCLEFGEIDEMSAQYRDSLLIGKPEARRSMHNKEGTRISETFVQQSDSPPKNTASLEGYFL